jgi:hypothetical protein
VTASVARRNTMSLAVAVLLPLLLFLVLAAPVHAASDVSATAWLSGPATLWSAVWGGSDTSTAATHLKAAIKSDFETAVTALDSGAGVTVNTLVPNTAPALGPAYGTQTTYTITSTTLTAAQIDECVRGATLTQVNALFGTLAPSLSLTITVLNAHEPAEAAQIVKSLLPLSGASYMWQVALDMLNTAGAAALSSFVVPLEADLQNAVDAVGDLYLVVVPTDVSASIVNASALYVGYSVWSYPSNTAPASAATLETIARTTPLTKFSSFVAGLETAYPALADYSDLLPSSVVVSTPLLPDPSSSTGGAVVEVVGNITGNYLLTFSGNAGTWGRVWATQRAAVTATIVAAAEAELLRREFVTTVEVLSASTVPNEKKYVGGLQVECYVAHGFTAHASHVWGPEELASMLLQGNYTATQALYTAAAATSGAKAMTPHSTASATATTSTMITAGALATAGVQYDYTAKLHAYEVGMIVMAAVIGLLFFVAFFIACGFCCCCPHCIRTNKDAATTADWEADLDRYHQGMKNQDMAFARTERPREEPRHRPHDDVVVDGVRSGTVSPNPLRSPTTQSIYSPREGGAQGLQQLRQVTPPPAQAPTGVFASSGGSDLGKKASPPVVTAQGVPLVSLQSPPVAPAEGQPPHYIASVAPAPFFNAPATEPNANGGTKSDALNQTRLNQGSEPRSHGSSPLPPPSYPQHEAPSRPPHHRSSPPAYPMQERTSPAYSPPPPTTAPAYPSPDLYAGAPAPPVTSSVGSFTPMPSLRKAD